jgi:hypothetical protein
VSDEFAGIFDHLTPADFERKTSAVAEDKPASDTFDRFVEDQIRSLRYAFAGSDGNLFPLTTIASATVERVYAADDDETLGQYVDRVAREARLISATRVFTFKKTVVGTFQSDEEQRSDSQEAMQEALDAGTTQEAVYWYAEERDGNQFEVRHGFVVIEGLATLGANFEGAPQRNELFSRVLGG